jgi:hypothetical protein
MLSDSFVILKQDLRHLKDMDNVLIREDAYSRYVP